MEQYLDFEKPIIKLEKKISDLKKEDKKTRILIAKKSKIIKKIYNNLTDWQIVKIARHPKRPYFLDLINKIFIGFQELHGDRLFSDDKAIVGGIGKLNKTSIMIIGQEKGRKTKNKLYHNFGMMHPEGYRKALRLMKLAEKFEIPIITFIDTPGAYPGVKAEERGQSEAIARNLFEMAKLNVPIISVIIGEGCSGGALGIGVGDKLLMLEYSYFATISPEGCASILWKTANKAADAAKTMNIISKKLKNLKIIDQIIKEPIRGAHNNIHLTAENIKKNLIKTLTSIKKLKPKTLQKTRYKKLTSYGSIYQNTKIT